MKALLGCLVCLVLTYAQAFAISGGPFGGRGHVLVTGTYAGVLIPTVDPIIGLSDNSLALFTMTIPKTSLGTGSFVAFRNGLFYSGTINATADPDSARLTGLLSASFDVSQREVTGTTISGYTTSDVTHTYKVSGGLVNTKIFGTQNSVAASSTRVKGKASLTYTTDAHQPNCIPNDVSTPPVTCPIDSAGDSGRAISYSLSGFKQAEATN